jgi:hypothetical protein
LLIANFGAFLFLPVKDRVAAQHKVAPLPSGTKIGRLFFKDAIQDDFLISRK